MSTLFSAVTAYTSGLYGNAVYNINQISPASTKNSESDTKPSQPNGEINDAAIISQEAKNLLNAEKAHSEMSHEGKDKRQKDSSSKNDLTPEEKQKIKEMESRDKEVKAHEQAHKAASQGINSSSPSYETKKGPDGKDYIVSGEVKISFTPTEDNEANLEKAKTLRNAALAPAEPSSQDLKVAQDATRMIFEYSQKIQNEKTKEAEKSDQKADKQSEKEDSAA